MRKILDSVRVATWVSYGLAFLGTTAVAMYDLITRKREKSDDDKG